MVRGFEFAVIGALAIGLSTAGTSALAQAGRELRIACQSLARHIPAPDVDYVPGVDVRGNWVAPADLPGSPVLPSPDRLDLKLSLNVLRQLGGSIGARSAALLGGLEIGTLSIEGNRISLNGQPLTQDVAAEIRATCAAETR